MAQIHRFGEHVAAYVIAGSKKETAYLTPKEARKLGKALIECARSCEREKFTANTFQTFELDTTGATLNLRGNSR